MSKSQLLAAQQETEVPLMSVNDADDGFSDEAAEDKPMMGGKPNAMKPASGKKKSRFSIWSPLSSNRKKPFLTGGRRDWKDGTEGGKRVSCRAWTCVTLIAIFFVATLLTVSLVYPLVRGNYLSFQEPNPWTTALCSHGMTKFVSLCPCLLTVNLTASEKPFRLQLDLLECIYSCTNDNDDDDDGEKKDDSDDFLDDDEIVSSPSTPRAH